MRARSARRCERCHLLSEWCVCSEVPRLVLRSTCLVIVQHVSEVRSTTNSARFCSEIFSDTLLIRRGERDGSLMTELPADGKLPLLLFPDESAETLDAT